MGCNKDCANCQKEYCTDVYREGSRYCNRSEQAKQKQKAYQKQKRDEAREKGFCIICRKKPKVYGSKCYECYIRQKRYDQRKNTGARKFWQEQGKCYFCGGEVVPNKKVCSKHYIACSKNIEICNSHPNTLEAKRRAKDEMQILWK